jgi:hypothetical protein
MVPCCLPHWNLCNILHAPCARPCGLSAPGGWVVVGFLHALSAWVALYRYQADRGVKLWDAAQFFTCEDVERLIGAPADMSEAAVYLAPQATAPFEKAERAGKQAENRPALEILRWRKSA